MAGMLWIVFKLPYIMKLIPPLALCCTACVVLSKWWRISSQNDVQICNILFIKVTLKRFKPVEISSHLWRVLRAKVGCFLPFMKQGAPPASRSACVKIGQCTLHPLRVCKIQKQSVSEYSAAAPGLLIKGTRVYFPFDIFKVLLSSSPSDWRHGRPGVHSKIALMAKIGKSQRTGGMFKTTNSVSGCHFSSRMF